MSRCQRGKSTLSMKEPNTLDGERSIQPLSTAIFLPAGHSKSVAQARSPHCLGWILFLLLGRPSSFLCTKSLFMPCSENSRAVVNVLRSAGKKSGLHHFVSPELSPLLRALVVGTARVEGRHWIISEAAPLEVKYSLSSGVLSPTSHPRL